MLALWQLIAALAIQGAQMALVLALAPLLTGFVRKVKARLRPPPGPAAACSPIATSGG